MERPFNCHKRTNNRFIGVLLIYLGYSLCMRYKLYFVKFYVSTDDENRPCITTLTVFRFDVDTLVGHVIWPFQKNINDQFTPCSILSKSALQIKFKSSIPLFCNCRFHWSGYEYLQYESFVWLWYRWTLIQINRHFPENMWRFFFKLHIQSNMFWASTPNKGHPVNEDLYFLGKSSTIY